ncbi:CRISPR-associated protein Cas1 [Bifidobacterium commune]|uniref:CRISPR-associated endonuclease Cas1 n=1 Tax=Bifidobacterium commune TaxID=1505727 RepID=A0A1C4H4D9_9BIFI|nr:type I-C CRISPR-associated endonuclease Cas1c [Bifidobacterium commune]MBB2955125.1 CRISPR-associated protein Cas1 [Bifidobacterium commune]SCC79651.1 CRISP-associated protein Cas1 [Bifidobacterium commune]
MRRLLNTLFVLTEEAYLSLKNENVVVQIGDKKLAAVPLRSIEQILCFSYKGASPALMGKCAEFDVNLSFYSPNGRYYCSIFGEKNRNVLLRREQFRIADNEAQSLPIAKSFILGKVFNCRWVLERTKRDHALRVNVERIAQQSALLHSALAEMGGCSNIDELRGLEGNAAKNYFLAFDDLVLRSKDDFYFEARSRRPPLDRLNALLSFVYTLLTHDCTAALQGVGLDPYVGFMHTDRPGRVSLALDLMEELRPVLADRFALSLINTGVIKPVDFEEQENGAVFLNEKGRKVVLSAWQKRKTEELTHPFLKEKMPWGLVPYIQALLLVRTLRGDLDAYPPLMWK